MEPANQGSDGATWREGPRSEQSWALVPQNWSCPICRRSKVDIFRLSSRGILLANLEGHHDHLRDYVGRRARPETAGLLNSRRAAVKSLIRSSTWYPAFPRTRLLGMQCRRWQIQNHYGRCGVEAWQAFPVDRRRAAGRQEQLAPRDGAEYGGLSPYGGPVHSSGRRRLASSKPLPIFSPRRWRGRSQRRKHARGLRGSRARTAPPLLLPLTASVLNGIDYGAIWKI
jgi:hypothetical protein